MAERTVSVIDDSIPTQDKKWINDTQPLCESCLSALVTESEWSESELKQLVESLVNDTTWNAWGFKHPVFFFSARDNEGFRPDVIVFDWEYAGGSEDSVSMLDNVVKGSHALVAIYSGTDHEPQIDEALSLPQFTEYRRRIIKILKTEDSFRRLQAELEKHYEENFSGKFSRDIRRAAGGAAESVLVEVGKHDIADVYHSLGHDGGRLLRDATVQKAAQAMETSFSVSSFLKDKYHDIANALHGRLRQFMEPLLRDPLPLQDAGEVKADAAKKLWEYTLYYRPADNFVRRGDIVSRDNQLYLVVNRSCDLERFWENGLGSLILTPLYEWNETDSEIKKRLLIAKKRKSLISNFKASSITNPGLPAGCFALPFVPLDTGEMLMLGVAKNITSYLIPIPETVSNSRISYDEIEAFERKCTLAEPYTGELVLFCLNSLAGWGVADYPEAFKDAISEDFKNGLPAPSDEVK